MPSNNMVDIHDIPPKIGNFVTLPISLPAVPTFPAPATHYLYVAADEPQVPTATTSRSLFLSNIPADSTEHHLKLLFSTQLRLPAGRIELVRFPHHAAVAHRQNEYPPPKASQLSKKRKRNTQTPTERLNNAPSLPPTWDRLLHKTGSIAIVVFVDRASMESALRVAKNVLRSRDFPVWGDGIEKKLQPLGVASECGTGGLHTFERQNNNNNPRVSAAP